MIIGVAGPLSSGKTTVVTFFKNQGYTPISLSDILREIATERGLEHDRNTLRALGNEFREKYGPGGLMQEALKRTTQHQFIVIDTIRTPGEVEELRKVEKSLLIAVDADPKIRYDRAKARELATGRQENATTFEKFLENEALENTNNPNGQQLKATMNLSDIMFINNGTPKELQQKIEHVFNRMPATNPARPSWEEYFVEIMRLVGRRCSCDRARVAGGGAVIVKNKRIISTGYVGAPAGLPNCDEVGHLFVTKYDERGGKHQHCVRTTHAEMNALINAAKYGISCEGATVYCFMEPCIDCTKAMISAGIQEIVCEKRYHAGHDSREMLKSAGITIKVLDEKEAEYANSKL